MAKSYCASTHDMTVIRSKKQSPSPVLVRNSDVSAQRRRSDAPIGWARSWSVLPSSKRQDSDNNNNSCRRMKLTKDTSALSGLSLWTFRVSRSINPPCFFLTSTGRLLGAAAATAALQEVSFVLFSQQHKQQASQCVVVVSLNRFCQVYKQTNYEHSYTNCVRLFQKRHLLSFGLVHFKYLRTGSY